MVDVGVPSACLVRFRTAIDKGEILITVDMPQDRVKEIGNLIKEHHPHAKVEGTDPTIPGFP
ncbi:MULTISPECIES: hypothetical protein [Burkholderia cepacia complex]|uniref:hypothetical protein n=1 Tax=Burkholderia cepacia complex TaxID=87882 RepID=UPI0021573549